MFQRLVLTFKKVSPLLWKCSVPAPLISHSKMTALSWTTFLFASHSGMFPFLNKFFNENTLSVPEYPLQFLFRFKYKKYPGDGAAT